MNGAAVTRVLVVDDDADVREAYRRMLLPAADGPLAELARDLFDEAPPANTDAGSHDAAIALVLASQGMEAVALAAERLAAGQPFHVAFVDMRMPPGIDGGETIRRLWQVDPDLQVVLATAYSDMPWQQLRSAIGGRDRLLILRKPFEAIEARQMIETLGQKRRQLDEVRLREDRLAALIEVRTAALQTALTEASAAARAKGEFLANMSHEIRTPLTAILGYAELLRQPDLATDERDELLATLARNGEHLLQLVDGVLDLSKLEAGRLHVESLPCAIRPLLADVERLLRQRAAARGLTLRFDCADDLPACIATDPLRLRQVLINLVDNAIKFTPAGAVTVHARRAAAAAADGERLELTIQDTGIGISDQESARLFQPFTQADASTTRRFGGTGLGLALSRRLTEQLGGTLTLASAPGQGSTFTVQLPLVPAPSTSATTSATTSAASDPARSVTLPTLRCDVLVVDDGADNRRLHATVLRRAGARVTTVDDGQQALDAIAARTAGPFDLVLMDMQMPVLDGYEATRRLRAAGYSAPIVALTAHALPGERDRCLAAGCDAYCQKPIRAADLVATCAHFAGGAAEGGAVPGAHD